MWETMTNKISFLMKSMSKELGRSDLKISQIAAHYLSTLDRNNLNLNQTSTDEAKEHLNYIDRACPKIKTELIQNLRDCNNKLCWRQPGFGRIPRKISRHMAVCEIIGPTGQIEHEKIRVGFLFQEAKVLYPRHSHAAEEIYLTLSGPSAWQKNDEKWRLHMAGDFIHHPSFHPHSIRTDQAPLLALWVWTGDIKPDSYQI